MRRIQATAGFCAFAREDTEQSIPERFDQQVRLYGNRLAIKTQRHELSYDALNRLSNRIAHAVLGSKALRGTPIAVMFEQDAPLIAAILGVLKAGNMYVPLDPRRPEQHRVSLLSDAQTGLILADRVNMPAASTLARQDLEIIEIEPASLEERDENPPIRLDPDALAYIYYTSGSTGRPKGVFDDHRNVLHNIMRYTNTLGITCDDRLTLLQSCEFSGAVSNIFSALLNGAALFPFDLHRDGVQRLAERLLEEKITIYHSVPTIFQRVVAFGPRFPSLRVIRLEGDRVTLRDVELYKKHFDSRCVLVNGLGATETGITRQYFIDPSTKIDGDVVPIGYATEDMTTLLLDSDGAVVPTGEIGEIAIKSRYLARGYWRQQDLTDSAFESCVDGSGARIYRTGDLGRLRSDGAIEYLGRKDFRVRIHGEWADLEAIENVLQRHDAVKEAIVDARSTPHAQPRLTAYLVTAQSEPLSSSTMRRVLAEAGVPVSMIPTSFVVLEELPLDSNGKVARNQLPVPKAPFVAPRNSTEARIAEVYRKFLRLSAVGVHDNFFELGGDSLSAMESALEMERVFSTSLPLAIFHQAPTVEEMAKAIDERKPAGSLVPFQAKGSKRPFFCVHAHMGHVFDLEALARQVGSTRPFFALQSRELAGQELPVTSLPAMAAHYLEEIRTVQPFGPYTLGGYCFGGLVALEMARQLEEAGEEIGLLALIDTAFNGLMMRSHRTWITDRWNLIQSLDWRSRASYLIKGLYRLTTRLAKRRWHDFLWLVRTRRDGNCLPIRNAAPDVVIAMIQRGYEPKPYKGRAVLFQSKSNPVNPAFRDKWQRLIAGGVEICPLPVTAIELMAKTHVNHLSAALVARLRDLDESYPLGPLSHSEHSTT